MLTYQDFEKVRENPVKCTEFVEKLIGEHRGSKVTKMAHDADEYFAQRNITINEYVKVLYTQSGRAVQDFTASNNRIASNFFFSFNTRRCAYSLGNGVQFEGKDVKEKMGLKFDTKLSDAALYALIHGRSFLFWNLDHVHVFKLTEFAPLEDEYTGAMRAGVRYWQLESDKPLNVTLYEEDGYTELRKMKGEKLTIIKKKQPYKQTFAKAPADAEETIVSGENYAALPIVTLWGSKLHQSTLVGMRGTIDAFDLIRSGFANDLQDCAEVYWILKNYNGMDDKDLAQFRDRLKLHHIATADTSDGGDISPHTQEIPHEARMKFLTEIRAGMYEDFGLLDLRTLSAAATNDHIDAGYQPQDDMADDFEYQIIEAVQQLLALQGIKDTPKFKRGRVSNLKEQVEILVMEAGMVDLPDEVLIEKFPNFTPEEVAKIIGMVLEENAGRVTREPEEGNREDEEGGPQDGDA